MLNYVIYLCLLKFSTGQKRELHVQFNILAHVMLLNLTEYIPYEINALVIILALQALYVVSSGLVSAEDGMSASRP